MKNINYILIVLGGLVAFYGESKAKQNPFLLIVGIAVLMIGIYRLSKRIPSKYNDDSTTDKNGDE